MFYVEHSGRKMKMKINQKMIKRIFVPVIIVVLLIVSLSVKENSMEEKFALTISSMNAEKQNLNNKIDSLEKELDKSREENGIITGQLRNAREDLADAGRRVKDNDDKLIIEAYELYNKGKVMEAQKKVQVLDTTYLTELQLYIYKKIMIEK